MMTCQTLEKTTRMTAETFLFGSAIRKEHLYLPLLVGWFHHVSLGELVVQQVVKPENATSWVDPKHIPPEWWKKKIINSKNAELVGVMMGYVSSLCLYRLVG